MKKLLALLFVSAAVFGGGRAGFAAVEDSGKSSNFDIRLNILPGCNFQLEGDSKNISFGSFIGLKEPRMAEGNFSLFCTRDYGGDIGRSVIVSLDGGEVNPNDKSSDRALYYNHSNTGDHSGKRMLFQIYQEKTGSVVWGDGTGDSKPYQVSIPAEASEKLRIPFHAQLFAQNLEGFPVGLYSNTLRVSVNYNN